MTPSEFYKQRRPELFSDSEIVNQVTLPREVLAYELSRISTNQKQDEFETLCRRLAEKFIAPNLIPQVGPTGGGDGKTDSETYPVSQDISERWFTPENGWDKNENWAFAMSAKEVWKGKAKSDVKKIVETMRGYTRVYFMSNQLISSKKKKDAQDEFIKEFEIDVVILDGEWILEKIYGNNLINLVVDALNLSDSFKSAIRLGSNDTARLKELEELEKKINNPAMYSEFDFQKVEDALESAILSRMLEKSRDEVEGKFDRALRFSKKLKNNRQCMRIYYQRAWTYLNWYDDYNSFIEEFLEFKNYITEYPNISEVEDYCTLFTSLYALKKINLENLGIDIEKEKDEIHLLLEKLINDKQRPTLSLFARTQEVFLELIYREKDNDKLIFELSEILKLSKNKVDYPFEIIQKVIEEIFSEVYPNNKEFDNLIDLLADISAKRSSELEAGLIFLKRATQKLENGNNKESVVYFGKAIVKIAKEETTRFLYFTLLGLGMAYRNLGLIWASNNCYITACHVSFKLSDKTGKLSKKTYRAVKEVLTNELFIGRIPYLLSWYEMLAIFHEALNIDDSKEEQPFGQLYDMTFAIRILYSKNTSTDLFKYLPKMLEYQMLPLTHDTVLYQQGYIDLVLNGQDAISDEKELDKHFQMLSYQPFVEQMLYDTNFMSDESLTIYSNLLGCKFQVNFSKDKEMLFIAETLLAFFESFMGTSLSNIHAHREQIVINIIKNNDNNEMYFKYDEEYMEYFCYINIQDDSELTWDEFMKFSIDILGRNFFMDDYEEHFTKLFQKEEVHERLSLILGHRNSIFNILGDNSKLFFDDWINYYKPSPYEMKRAKPISVKYEKIIKEDSQKYKKEDIEEVAHNQVATHTVIDVLLWDKAKWKGVGFAFHPQDGLYMLLAFDNIEFGGKIFDKWLEKFGSLDKEDVINITIIKGIDKKEPFAYKVMISKNDVFIKSTVSDGITNIITRFHKMDAKTPDNLNNLVSGFKNFKKYKLIPASMNDKGGVEPIFDKAITKSSLIIKDAWEIGINDLERAVIQKDDNPIIPEKYKDNAPILEVLKEFKKFK